MAETRREASSPPAPPAPSNACLRVHPGFGRISHEYRYRLYYIPAKRGATGANSVKQLGEQNRAMWANHHRKPVVPPESAVKRWSARRKLTDEKQLPDTSVNGGTCESFENLARGRDFLTARRNHARFPTRPNSHRADTRGCPARASRPAERARHRRDSRGPTRIPNSRPTNSRST